MGGLYPKMKITALTMLAGVLAIAGIPLFCGWYSKDAILAHALGFVMVHKEHVLLFLLPLATAGHHHILHVPDVVHDLHRRAARPARSRACPRIALVDDRAADRPGRLQHRGGLGLAGLGCRGELLVESHLHHAQPVSVQADFGTLGEEPWAGLPTVNLERQYAATLSRAGRCHRHGAGPAGARLRLRPLLAALPSARSGRGEGAVPGRVRFLQHKWYFDELYSAILVRPALVVATLARWFDTHVIDGIVNGLARGPA